jgi:L-iditol 2-dehydrogenase
MKALVKTTPGPGHIELQELPIPQTGPEEVLVKVVRAGVCGTDVHIQYDRFANSPPLVLGHEFSGIVVEIGSRVTLSTTGERVVAANNPSACGTCKVCKKGYPNLCRQKKAMGIHSDGCFADYLKLPAHLIHRIPDHVSLDSAALMEPVAVATHTVAHRCGIQEEDFVVVFGVGAIGLLAAQIARAEGANSVLLVGTSKDEGNRFSIAHELDLKTINGEKEDVPEMVMDLTGGEGADVVVEASGSPAAIHLGVSLLNRLGRMAITGITGRDKVDLAWDGLIARGATLYYCYSSVDADWHKGLHYLATGQVNTNALITHRFALEQWQEAFTVLEHLEAIRPMFLITDSDRSC